MDWIDGLPDGLQAAVDASPALTPDEKAALDVRQLRAFEALHLLHLLREADAAAETLRRVHGFVATLLPCRAA